MMDRMIRQGGDVLRSHPYVRVFALLLLTVALLVGGTAAIMDDTDNKCSCASDCSCDTKPVKRNPYEIGGYVDMLSTGYHYAGEEVNQFLRFYGYGPVTHVTVIYTPPPGVTGLKFGDPQPIRRLPDGSYVWENVPVEPMTEPGSWRVQLSSSHIAPPVPPTEGSYMSLVSTLTVRAGDYQDTGSLHYNVWKGHRLAAELPAALPPADDPVHVQPQSADYYLWQAQTWAFTDDVNLTTNVCQQWVDLLESEDVFLAMRFPLLDATPPYTESYRLPVVFSGQYRPTVRLLDESHYPFTTPLMTTLEYKPKHHTFLNNELPRADNERWFAMGLPTNSAMTCPAGLNIPAGDWEVLTDAYLDFGGEKADCENCILPIYYCYEGQEPPTIPGVALDSFGMTATAYQDWGITCIGPHLLWLTDPDDPNPAFHIHLAGTATVLPSARVTFTHLVVNLGTSPVSVTLSVTSTLGGSWQLVGKNDPPTAISQPISLPTMGSQLEFRVVGTVPADAQGEHVIYVTATNASNASQQTQTTDLLWVGEWEPPPPHRVYLPVVMAR